MLGSPTSFLRSSNLRFLALNTCPVAIDAIIVMVAIASVVDTEVATCLATLVFATISNINWQIIYNCTLYALTVSASA